MPLAVIALGSDVGDRLAHLQRAVQALTGQLTIQKTSRVYETAPMYVEDQPAFYNAAVLACTELSPASLLGLLKEIEHELGREQRQRNGPREIDLDLISYGVAEYRFRADGVLKLELPHPRAKERRFVLQPLFDLMPNGFLPNQGSIRDLLTQTEEQAASVLPIEHADLSL